MPTLKRTFLIKQSVVKHDELADKSVKILNKNVFYNFIQLWALTIEIYIVWASDIL